MVVIVGLIVVLVVLTFALTTLTSAAGTHDSFAVLSQRIGGSVVARPCQRIMLSQNLTVEQSQPLIANPEMRSR
ncbi:MAG: hypothetical protein WA317_21180 [Mycobacterium sp.]|uniref:hypothetical protein n=1 Tax=Mycobacterium sp. TaxID=1785 RepID=UPI003CC60A0B